MQETMTMTPDTKWAPQLRIFEIVGWATGGVLGEPAEWDWAQACREFDTGSHLDAVTAFENIDSLPGGKQTIDRSGPLVPRKCFLLRDGKGRLKTMSNDRTAHKDKTLP